MKQPTVQAEPKPFLILKSKSIPRLPLFNIKPPISFHKSHTRLNEVGKDRKNKEMRLISLHQMQKSNLTSVRKWNVGKLKISSLNELAKVIKVQSTLINFKAIHNNESLANTKENSQSSRMSSSTLPSSRNFHTNKTNATTNNTDLKREELNRYIRRQDSTRKVSGTNTRCNSRMNMVNKLIVNCKEFEAESNICENIMNAKRNKIETTVKSKEEENRVFVGLDEAIRGMKAMKTYECFTEVYDKKLTWTLARISRNKNILKNLKSETYKKDNEVMLHRLVKAKSKKDSNKESKRSALFKNYTNRVIQTLSCY